MSATSSPPSLDERFDAYCAEAELYGATWWKRDEEPQRSRLAACPGLYDRLQALAEEGELIQTEWVYRDGSGWDGGRCRLHRELLESVVPRSQPANTVVAPALCFLTLGLPGSGKSRVLRRVLTAYLSAQGWGENICVCDADELRVRFPEYSDGPGSVIVQKELVRLAYDDETDPLADDCPCLQERMITAPPEGAVLVIDTVGSDEHCPPIVTHLVARGVQVHVLVTSLPVEEAVRRAKQRALETGRIVMPEVIAAAAGRPEAALRACIDTGALAGYALLDTSGPPDTPSPVLTTDERATYGRVAEPVAYW